MSKTNTKEITIQGVAFNVSQPYSEGHPVTEAEARALNQTRSENVRNNMAKAVKAAKEAAGEGNPLADDVLSSLAMAVSEYDDAYIFTLASIGGGRKSKDPVEIEATRMAKAAIMGQLKKAGKKLADVDPDAFKAKVAEVAELPQIVKAATKSVKDRAALAEEALAGLEL